MIIQRLKKTEIHLKCHFSLSFQLEHRQLGISASRGGFIHHEEGSGPGHGKVSGKGSIRKILEFPDLIEEKKRG